jgi:hypothetical protein
MVSHQFVVSIMGNIDQELLLSLINITDKKLTKMEVERSMKKKIFHFMIECAQNLSKIEKPDNIKNNSIFLIGKKNDDYMVYLGSILSKEELSKIVSVVDEVNNIETEEIKANYYKELTENNIDKMNPFFMSMLSISKRMKEKINFDVIPVDEKNQFLSFNTTISNLKLTDGIYY